jgi:hypothetical protein
MKMLMIFQMSQNRLQIVGKNKMGITPAPGKTKCTTHNARAWAVGVGVPGGGFSDYVILVHAATRGKACSAALRVWPDLYQPDYTELRAVRLPALDALPITLERVHNANVFTNNDELLDHSWINFCACELCENI